MLRKGIVFKGSSGSTLIELLVAMTIFLTITSIAFVGWLAFSRHFSYLSSLVEARQEVRNISYIISDDIKNSTYIYANRSATINGVSIVLPPLGQPGQSLVLAIPELNSGGSTTYTIVCYYLGSPYSDPTNDKACDFYRYEVKGVVSPGIEMPYTINLNSLSGGTRRRIASYINSEKFSVRVIQNGSTVLINPLASKRARANQRIAEASVVMRTSIRNQ